MTASKQRAVINHEISKRKFATIDSDTKDPWRNSATIQVNGAVIRLSYENKITISTLLIIEKAKQPSFLKLSSSPPKSMETSCLAQIPKSSKSS